MHHYKGVFTNMKKRIISFVLSIVMILLIIPPTSYSAQAANFETELRNAGFPDTYISKLTALHEKYPNWKFEPLIVGENFSTAVSKERQTGGHAQQLIQQYSGNDGRGFYCTCSSCTDSKGNPIVKENPNWVAASQSAVEYYLDPRNFLNEEYIFQFESNAYNSTHTQTGVEYILAGTFMYKANIAYQDANGKTQTYTNSSGNTVKYSKAIMDAAKHSNLSAYYLASKIVQEVGGATASAGGASGTNSTYPGIYNFYNIEANTGALDGLKWASESYKWVHISVTYNGRSYNGYIREDLVDKKSDGWYTNTTCKLRQGPSTSTDILTELTANTKLTYIETVNEKYNRPWTDPYLSIYNGAKWIADNFSTQYTGYLQKFNVNPASGSSMHNHEYMANVQGAASEGAKTYKAYKNANVLSESMTFTIPVFSNMPDDYPTGITANATNSGIKISWNSYPGAQKYRVYYRTATEGWTKITDTTSTSCTWAGAKAGTKYFFTVKCISSDGTTATSDYDKTGASLTYAANPTLSSVANAPTGVQITWNKVSGAEKYRVFYKTGSGDWAKVTDTTSTSYTWTGANSGTKYSFTVRCITSDGKTYTSGYDTTGKSLTYIAAPKLTSINVDDSGTVIKWEKVTGASKYRVFRKTASGSWTTLTNTTSTSFTDKTASKGTAYSYTVRCIDANGNYISSYDPTGLSIKAVEGPAISSLSPVTTGIQINWGKVNGAEKYRVFYKADGESTWRKVVDTTATSYTWTGAKSNTKYFFTVRCMTSDGNSYTSSYDTTGKSIQYIAAPKISSLSNATTGIEIKWGSVAGATKYRVFYKANDESSWHKVVDTTATSYIWTGAKSGTKYTITVRCLGADGTSYTSAYDTVGKSINYIAAPNISSLSNTATGVEIKWGNVAGAAKYRVFYKANGESSWHKVVDTTATSYIWTGAQSGTKYTFTVRCMTSDGNSYTSAYDTTGKSITYIAAPNISSLSKTSSGVQIKWSSVTGAEKYRVFYKENGESSWHKVVDTTATNYTWSGAKSGTKYTFTVRCMTSDCSSYTSGYDTVGKSITV